MDRRRFVGGLLALCGAGLAGCLDDDGSDSGDRPSGPSTSDDPRTVTPEPTPRPTPTPSDATPEDDDSPAPPRVAEWATFGADAANRAYRPSGTGPSTGTIAWSAIEDARTVPCSPVVKGGTVYVGTARPDAIHAFDAVTGDREWEFPTVDHVTASPTVRDGRVYVGDAKGNVYALTTGGTEIWRREAWLPILGHGLVARDGRVYGGTTDDVFALDAGTGERLWSFTGFSDWASTPAFGDSRVYVGSHDGEVAALDPATGEKQWTWTSNSRDATVWAPPAYAHGTVYVNFHSSAETVALDAESGNLVWYRKIQSLNVKSSPAVTEDRVYVGGTTYFGTFSSDRSENTETATETTGGGARVETTDSGTPDGPPPPGTVGRLYALDRTDGSDVWVHRRHEQFRTSPAVVGDRVYVGSGNGALAVSRADGSQVWKVSFDERVHSSPAVARGRLFVGSMDGRLYCIARDAVDRYDRDDDGAISLSELAAAAADYTRSDIYIADLARVAARYADRDRTDPRS